MSNIWQTMAEIELFSSDEAFGEAAVYCFKAVDFNSRAILYDGRGNIVYVPCNRNMSPINVTLNGKVDLIEFVETHGVIFECHPLELEFWEKHSTIRHLYVLDDSLNQRMEYGKRMNDILDIVRPYDPIRIEHLRYVAVGDYRSI